MLDLSELFQNHHMSQAAQFIQNYLKLISVIAIDCQNLIKE